MKIKKSTLVIALVLTLWVLCCAFKYHDLPDETIDTTHIDTIYNLSWVKSAEEKEKILQEYRKKKSRVFTPMLALYLGLFLAAVQMYLKYKFDQKPPK